MLAVAASLTLGLAPLGEQSHLMGKINWVLGGGEGMKALDYGDLFMHAAPWIALIYFGFKFLEKQFSAEGKAERAALAELVKSGKAKVIDVREAKEFNADHFKGATNFPLSKLDVHLADIQNIKEPIVLYCRSGNRSGQALRFLKKHGVNEVFNAGGLGSIRGLARK